jgi:DNA-binding transcriptional LysR family regulator
MQDHAFDLRYLHCAIVVAERGSIRRAAEALEISQATLSRRLQLLERRLGVALFERCRRGVRLTHAGEKFIRDAAAGASQLHQAISGLALVRRGDFGQLSLGLLGSLATGFLADLLFSFHSRFPKVGVKLEETSSQSGAAAVLSGRLDAAFITGDAVLPGCETRRLWDERILVALPLGHPLAQRESVDWRALRSEMFLVAADGPGPEIEDYLVARLSGLGFRPKISTQKVGRDNLFHLVAGGFGLTLTCASAIGATYAGVTFVPVGDDSERIVFSVVWPSNSQNLALKKLLDLCEAVIASGRRERPAPRVAGSSARPPAV